MAFPRFDCFEKTPARDTRKILEKLCPASGLKLEFAGIECSISPLLFSVRERQVIDLQGKTG